VQVTARSEKRIKEDRTKCVFKQLYIFSANLNGCPDADLKEKLKLF